MAQPLSATDPAIYELILKETRRQDGQIELIASENFTSEAVLEATGFEVPEIDLLIDGLNIVPEADLDDQLPHISETAITVPGDLWQVGKHRVLCGNSLITTDYDRLMDGAKEVKCSEFGDALIKAL